MTTPRSMLDSASHGNGGAAWLVGPGILCAATLGLMAAAATRAADPAPAPDDRTISVGCWDVVAAEWDGTPVDPDLLSRLQVVFQDDGSWVVLLRRIPVAEGTSTSRQDDSPKTFEMETLGSDGIPPSRYTGIYRFDGESRVLCFSPAGQPRPDGFAAPRHSERMLVTLKRAKPPPVGR